MSSSITRKLKRAQDKAAQGKQLTAAQNRLPVGRVTTNPIKGSFQTLPLLGWVSVRDRERIPLVMLTVALLDTTSQKIRGLVQLEYPIYLETEAATIAVLREYGWQGGCWRPGDESWPTGDDENEAQIRELLSNAGLSATLTFPPDSETGAQTTRLVEVSRARGPFLMPPLPEPEECAPEALEASLRALVKDYRSFHPGAAEAPQEAENACLNCGAPGEAREDKVVLCDPCFKMSQGKERGVAFVTPEAPE